MVWQVENARELSGFLLLCAFSPGTYSFNDQAEGAKDNLTENNIIRMHLLPAMPLANRVIFCDEAGMSLLGRGTQAEGRW
jgi:hypothetical protein